MHDDGTVTATVGTSSHGQGHETAFAMIVADLLGVPDRRRAPRAVRHCARPRGRGHRRIPVAADRRERPLPRPREAVVLKARQLAAHLLEADEADITLVDGSFSVAGVPAASIGWAELGAGRD